MPRSGISLMGAILHNLGVYMDPAMGVPAPDNKLAQPDALKRSSGYGEAIPFRLLNEAVLRSAGAVWHDVLPFLAHRDAPGFAARNTLRMELATYGSLIQQYLAPFPRGYKGAWGWKDPRNSLTLPYWLRLFPDARILHVRRDEEAIARSLMRRAEATAAQNLPLPTPATRVWNAVNHPDKALRGIARRLNPAAIPLSTAFDVSKREDCLRLTDIYVAECLRYQEHPGGYLEVEYEQILSDPAAMVQRLSDFAGVAPSDEQKQRAAAFVTQNGARG